MGHAGEHLCRQIPRRQRTVLQDIIAGHIGTCSVSGDRRFHDVYWDGASHYYIDGTVYMSKHLPVLMYDEETGKYSSLGGGQTEKRI